MSATATPATVTGPEATVFNDFPTKEDLARRIWGIGNNNILPNPRREWP